MNCIVMVLLAVNALWVAIALICTPRISLRLNAFFQTANASRALFIFTLMTIATTFATI